MTTSAALAEPSSSTGSQPGSPAATDNGLVTDDVMQALALTAQPFSDDVPDNDWFADNTTREQLVDIKEALINGEDLLLITGESGSGKTVLLKQLSGSGGSRIQCFSVRGSQRFSTSNLFAGLLEAFKLKPPAELEDTLKDVIPCLQALAERNMLGVIALDDADLVSDQELSLLLGSLQYLNGGEDSLLRILLAAKPEFEARIPSLLATTSELPYATLAIEPFDIGRSTAYLEHRLNKVGTFNELPFSEQQLLSICHAANGLPSGLNTLAADEINAFHRSLTDNNDQNGTLPAAGAANQSQLPASGTDAVTTPSILQKQPLRMVLGLAAVAMLATAAWLFVNPAGPTQDDGGFAVVSKSPVTPISEEPESPELIALVQEAATPKATTPAAATPAAPTTSNLSTDSAASPTEKSSLQTSNSQAADATDSQADTDSNTAAGPESASQTDATGKSTVTETSQTATQAVAASEESVTTTVIAPLSGAEGNIPQTAAASAGSETASTEAAATANALPLESANWVLVQDRELYTVQMSASDDRKDVEDFLRRSKLASPNSIFSFKRGNNTWFALVHGLYPTITEARNAIESMPQSAKANQPWIRAISQIQDSVKNN